MGRADRQRARSGFRARGQNRRSAGSESASKNHQDFTSAELVAFRRESGVSMSASSTTPATAFQSPRRRSISPAVIAPHVYHVHLKDYRGSMDGRGHPPGALRHRRRRRVPFLELTAMLHEHPSTTLTAGAGATKALWRRGMLRLLHAGLVARLCSPKSAPELARLSRRRAAQPASPTTLDFPHALGAPGADGELVSI